MINNLKAKKSDLSFATRATDSILPLSHAYNDD